MPKPPFSSNTFDNWDEISGEERINRLMNGYSGDERFTTPLFPISKTPNPLTLHSITTSSPSPSSTTPSSNQPQTSISTTTFTYKIPHLYTNMLGNLHGGAAATIFDIATTLALAPISSRKRGYWMLGGVSRGLNVRYLRPAGEGEEVLVICEVVHAGRQMAALKGTMVRVRDGAVLSTCEHDKVNTDPSVKAKL